MNIPYNHELPVKRTLSDMLSNIVIIWSIRLWLEYGINRPFEFLTMRINDNTTKNTMTITTRIKVIMPVSVYIWTEKQQIR